MGETFSERLKEFLEERAALEQKVQELERKIKVVEKIIASVDAEIEKEENSHEQR